MKITVLKNLFYCLLTVGLSTTGMAMFPMESLAGGQPRTIIAAETTGELTEAKIREVMAVIEKAEKEEDIETLLTTLAPFAVSEVAVEVEEQGITRTVEGIEAHRQLLEQTFALIEKREPINQFMSIRFTADNQVAIVTRFVLEALTTTKGKSFYSSGTDIFRFAWLDGRPRIISTKSQGWIEERPPGL